MLLVGRLVYEKGFHLALDALAPIVQRGRKLRFVVAGTGSAEQELKRQAKRLGLARHGTFLGWVGDDMLHALYRAADLCIVPVDLRAVRDRRARGDGLRLPLHRRQHRRPA